MQNLKVIENELIPAYETSTEVKRYNEKIVDMVERIEDVWILQQIHRCITNIMR